MVNFMMNFYAPRVGQFFAILLFSAIVLMGCEAKIDREFKKVSPFMGIVERAQFDSLPDSAANMMMKFVMEFPEHSQAQKMTVAAFRVAEKKGWMAKASEWSQFYVDKFNPTGDNLLEMLVLASFYHEQVGLYDKAIANYKRIKKEFKAEGLKPNYRNLFEQSQIMLEMLEKGIVDPEKQSEYLMRRSGMDTSTMAAEPAA